MKKKKGKETLNLSLLQTVATPPRFFFSSPSSLSPQPIHDWPSPSSSSSPTFPSQTHTHPAKAFAFSFSSPQSILPSLLNRPATTPFSSSQQQRLHRNQPAARPTTAATDRSEGHPTVPIDQPLTAAPPAATSLSSSSLPHQPCIGISFPTKHRPSHHPPPVSSTVAWSYTTAGYVTCRRKSTNQEKERNQKRADLKGEEELKLCLRFFFLLQVTVVAPPARKGRREEAEPDPVVSSCLRLAHVSSCLQRYVNSHAASI